MTKLTREERALRRDPLSTAALSLLSHVNEPALLVAMRPCPVLIRRHPDSQEPMRLVHIHVVDGHDDLPDAQQLAGDFRLHAVRVERRCQLCGDVRSFLVFDLVALHHVDQLPAA